MEKSSIVYSFLVRASNPKNQTRKYAQDRSKLVAMILLLIITNVKRGTLIFSHHADSLDRWAPSSSVSRPCDAMMSLYHRFPQPYSRRRDSVSWTCWAPCCIHQIPDWVNWPLQPHNGYKMEPFNRNRRYESSCSVQARQYHCSCSFSS
jgi:hypothetical protein